MKPYHYRTWLHVYVCTHLYACIYVSSIHMCIYKSAIIFLIIFILVMFQASRIHKPSEDLLRNVAKKLNLDVTDEEITVYKGKNICVYRRFQISWNIYNYEFSCLHRSEFWVLFECMRVRYKVTRQSTITTPKYGYNNIYIITFSVSAWQIVFRICLFNNKLEYVYFTRTKIQVNLSRVVSVRI